MEGMEWLNYHHLYYFWVVAREGSISRATRKLRLAQPTISGQIRALENTLGEKLFTRSGRNIVLTENGRLAYRYAEEIFTLGRELTDTLKDRPTGKPLRLTIGVADALPKLVAYRLIKPVYDLEERVRIVCREESQDRLLAELAIHGVDIVLADAPIGPTVKIRGYNHLLEECGVSLFGTPRLASICRKGFPRSLNGVPFLLPTANTALRKSLELWFEVEGIRPETVGEFEDSALLKVFAEAGHGIFAAPSVIEEEIQRKHGTRLIGRLPSVRERFYAITVERKIRHPAIIAITETARRRLSVVESLGESPIPKWS